MKKIKKEKLQFEKFSVAELNNLKSIKGGDNDLPTKTIDLTVLLATLSSQKCGG